MEDLVDNNRRKKLTAGPKTEFSGHVLENKEKRFRETQPQGFFDVWILVNLKISTF